MIDGFNILSTFPAITSPTAKNNVGADIVIVSTPYLYTSPIGTWVISQANNGTDNNQRPNYLRWPSRAYDGDVLTLASNYAAKKVSEGGSSANASFVLTFSTPTTVMGVYGKWSHSASAEGNYSATGRCIYTIGGVDTTVLSSSGNTSLDAEYKVKKELVSKVNFTFQAGQDRGGDNPNASNSGGFQVYELAIYVEGSGGYGVML